MMYSSKITEQLSRSASNETTLVRFPALYHTSCFFVLVCEAKFTPYNRLKKMKENVSNVI